MASRRLISPELSGLLNEQDGIATAAQLLAYGIGPHVVSRRVGAGVWQRILPGVLATFSGTPTRRQLLIAGWLYGGPSAVVDGIDACNWYGVRGDGFRAEQVHIVVPWASGVRSRDFVIVRRSLAPIMPASRGHVPYVDAATAFIVGARGAPSERAGIALLSRGLQEGIVTVSELAEARERIGDKWCRGVDGALIAVGVGLRSPAELDARNLILSSRVLPEPLWNQWLDLGDGGPLVCVDALLLDAGLANEVIGKKYHAWGEQYERTQERKERVQAAGLVINEMTPQRVRRNGLQALTGLERMYVHYRGRGMPPGVTLADPPTIARG